MAWFAFTYISLYVTSLFRQRISPRPPLYTMLITCSSIPLLPRYRSSDLSKVTHTENEYVITIHCTMFQGRILCQNDTLEYVPTSYKYTKILHIKFIFFYNNRHICAWATLLLSDFDHDHTNNDVYAHNLTKVAVFVCFVRHTKHKCLSGMLPA